MTLLDKEICNRLKVGDEKAFEYLFNSFYEPLCYYAFGLLRCDGASEEVVQEALVKIWEDRGKLNIEVSLKSYLYRTIHNRCVNFLNSQKARQNTFEKYLAESKSLNSGILSEEYTVENYLYDGVENDLQDAIDSLPEQCRTIFQLNRFELIKYEEIAARLNISVNTVKTQLTRALRKLRSHLNQKMIERKDLPIKDPTHYKSF